MKSFLIIGHRRSGNHFLWHLLKSNFGTDIFSPSKKFQFTYHRPIKSANPEALMKSKHCIHLMRDCRDVLVSSWYYWRKGKESNYGVRKIFENSTFSQYLHGELPVDNKGTLFSNPIKHWLEYTEWVDVLFTVKFEDLKIELEKTMKDIGDYFNLLLINSEVKTVNNLVGHATRKGIIGDWKNHFTDEDLDYFWERAGETMETFGYTKEGVLYE
jgi:hypothetical protein